MHIEVQEEKCSGCRLCQQICAIHHFKEINPKKSSINIRSRLPAPGGFTPKVCDRCGECADVCLMGAIELKDGAYAVDADLCTFCLSCVDACPNRIIAIHDDEDIPIMCDLCLRCTTVCNTGAITAVKDS